MSTVAAALAYKRLLDEDHATLTMLRANHLPVVAAVLSAHLGQAGHRLPVEDLHEKIDLDLEDLRSHFALSTKNAKAFCDDWRDANLLVRRPATQSRGETYELSPGALDALRIVDQLQAPRTTMTESRLVSLAAAVRQLAVDTDPDQTRRLERLHREREQIDAEIARVDAGDVAVLETRRAVERATDILMQADGLPADFARVRARFEELNKDLRASILSMDDSQSSVLDDVFRGVDMIESSDEGRTFTAFSALIRDPERAAALDADLAAVLGRDFAGHLSPDERRTLRTLVRHLKSGSRDVHSVLTEFARGLRRYVFSQEFQRDRALRLALQDALALAVPASRATRPTGETGVEIELSAMRLTTSGEVTPHDPEEFDTGAPLAEDSPTVVDFATLAAIARESEIDFVELTDNVNSILSTAGQARVSDVLRTRPATQGLASIVGLLSLAVEHGHVDLGSTDEVSWVGTDDISRSATVIAHVFTRRIER